MRTVSNGLNIAIITPFLRVGLALSVPDAYLQFK